MFERVMNLNAAWAVATIPFNCPNPAHAALPLLPQVGFNKWESMETVQMERCPELRETLPGPDWWRVALPLPELLFRVDFVTVDVRSGAVDNNGWVHGGHGEGEAGMHTRYLSLGEFGLRLEVMHWQQR